MNTLSLLLLPPLYTPVSLLQPAAYSLRPKGTPRIIFPENGAFGDNNVQHGHLKVKNKRRKAYTHYSCTFSETGKITKTHTKCRPQIAWWVADPSPPNPRSRSARGWEVFVPAPATFRNANLQYENPFIPLYWGRSARIPDQVP